MEKYLIHSNELHLIDAEKIHQAVEKMVESLDLAAGSTTNFDLYQVVENYFNKGDWAYNEQVGLPIMFPDWEPVMVSVSAGETSPEDAAATLDRGLADACEMIGWPGW